jgi:hypothetical protein
LTTPIPARTVCSLLKKFEKGNSLSLANIHPGWSKHSSENGVELMNSESPWNVYRTRFLVRARQLTEPLIFTDTLGREHSGRSGDYLVETSDGIRRITTRALFEDIYVPISETGSASLVSEPKRPASETRPQLVTHNRATA